MTHQLHQQSGLALGLFVVLAAASHVYADGEGLKLATDGRAQSTIVLAEKPTAAAQLAAFELQYYLEKISGAKLPIVREPQAVEGTAILVGDSQAPVPWATLTMRWPNRNM
ncbi:MAG: hypothetical protein CMJ64_15140 [Planctomycetaceae bacterium]|nr:hypothetical protein [Planctomycetaceae bacterium]